MDSIISMKDICKSYNVGTEQELEILKAINLEVKAGEFLAVVGASGSGKSTLMNIIGALDKQTKGSYLLDGLNLLEAEEDELAEIRNKKIGFIFQNFNLIPKHSAIKNVELPMLYAGVGKKEREERSEELLNLVGMYDRREHKPNELSGGQKQRVAIARALANNPSILLADEPTGALDSKTGRMVMDLFLKINQEEKRTIVFITHSNELASETSRQIIIKDGRIC
ncbi:MAG: ABC transporter ATP-binding protein [Anaerovoracaceae bacterium]